ncbi:hypothetical protein LTR78_002482 [Recurvomyces mirabilis]|uniref:2-nitropropane dioxygenase n=1 Tax=Recurvomyces mirabilis TaxID=574656 RepID=A0AAE0WT52_9PEZI|nr:hypothetical protein LTR78_002482 [Recurvomyces mirabilis]KAK5157411.1 hypothetical protein LTS14_004176 [Recurvomyces mirabilis]
MDKLQQDYPWTKPPLISCGPMRLIALSQLATAVSSAGGLGFLGAGSDVSTLASELDRVKDLAAKDPTLRKVKDVLPIGVGFLLWAGDDLLQATLPILKEYTPAAIWFFAPSTPQQLQRWTEGCRRATSNTSKIWIQVGTVADAVSATKTCNPDVLVIQGSDAGGHGLMKSAGLISLLPEVSNALQDLCTTHPDITKPTLIATGGITESRGAAAALALGAEGICMGTRFLATPEANIKRGYRNAVLAAKDGGVSTARGHLYDTLRGTTSWPERYGGRGVLNQSWRDAEKGMRFEENKKKYESAEREGEDQGWGEEGRMTTYAGVGVGLIREVKPAAEVVEEVREGCRKVLGRLGKL